MAEQDNRLRQAVLSALMNNPIVNAVTAPARATSGLLNNVGTQQVQAAPIPSTIPVQSQQSQQSTPQPTQTPQPKEENKDPSKIGEILKRLGVPLGAAVAGSVNPNLLPEAAGLATGFNTGFQESEKQKLEAEEKIKKELLDDEIAIVDKETGKVDVIRGVGGRKVLTKRGEIDDLQDKLDQLIGGKTETQKTVEEGGVNSAVQKKINEIRNTTSKEDIIKFLKEKNLNPEDFDI